MIARSVIRGVTALIIPARMEVTLVSARAKRKPGTTLRSIAMTQRWAHTFLSFGKAIFFDLAIVRSAIAPKDVRPKATPTGVRNSSPNLMKIKEQPHTTPKAM